MDFWVAWQRGPHANASAESSSSRNHHLVYKENQLVCAECYKNGSECNSTRSSNPSSSPNFRLPGTEQERRSFHYFHHQVVAKLTEWVDDKFWTVLVPSRSYSEPAVRHAVISLSAVYEVLNSKMTPERSAELETFKSEQYQIAFQYINDYLKNPNHQSTEVTMLCCLLFVNIENLQGNIDLAFLHLEGGLNISEQYKLANRRKGRKSTEDSAGSSSTESSREVSHSRVTDDVLEDLVDHFSRLDLQATYISRTNRPLRYDLFSGRIESIKKISAYEFTSIASARQYLSWIVRWTTHFLEVHIDKQEPGQPLKHAAESEYQEILGCAQNWSNSFQEYVSKAHDRMGQRELQAVALLKLHYISSRFNFQQAGSSGSLSETVCQEYCQEILDLAELLIKATNVKYAVSCELIYPIWTVVNGSSNRATRYRAYQLLSSGRRLREHWWDGKKIAALAKQILETGQDVADDLLSSEDVSDLD